ncbi:hypothetical protein evm_006811 [Chilo suppressalis]|nr:hypothetical protein evm_006811 [Chilo suppressalis]
MDEFSEKNFKNRYRFSKENMKKIINILRDDLSLDNRGGSIPVELQVIAVIRYWGRHEIQEDCAEIHGISRTLQPETTTERQATDMSTEYLFLPQPSISRPTTGVKTNRSVAILMEHNYCVTNAPKRSIKDAIRRTPVYNRNFIRPLQTKMRSLHTEIKRLRKRGKLLKERIANAEKISKNMCFQQVSGLVIVNTVCDQSTVNVGAITEIINESKETFLRQGKEWRHEDRLENFFGSIRSLFATPWASFEAAMLILLSFANGNTRNNKPKLNNGQHRITEFIDRRRRLCQDCKLERASGGNDGYFHGKYTTCTGGAGCGKNQAESSEGEDISEYTEEIHTELAFNKMVREFLAKRGHSSGNEAIFKNSKRRRTSFEEHEPLQCGSNDTEDNERIFHTYEDTKQGLDKLWLQYFRGVVLKRRIIHDVWEAPVDGLGKRFRESIVRPLQYSAHKLRRTTSDGRCGGGEFNISGIFIIAEHEKHLHVIHDCTYSGSTCRCIHVQRLRDYITTSGVVEEIERWAQSQVSDVPEGEISLYEAENLERHDGRRGLRGGNISSGSNVRRENSGGGERAGSGYGNSTESKEENAQREHGQHGRSSTISDNVIDTICPFINLQVPGVIDSNSIEPDTKNQKSENEIEL